MNEQYLNFLSDIISGFMKESKSYEEFLSKEDTFIPVVGKRNLCLEKNDGKAFISVRLDDSSILTLSHCLRKLFYECDNWHDFIRNSEVIVSSLKDEKCIREIIFGECNSEKQVEYKNYVMNQLCRYIKEKLPMADFYSLDEKEILIEVPKFGCGFSLNELKNIVCSYSKIIKDIVDIGSFELIKTDYGWIRVYNTDDGKIELCREIENGVR